MAAPDFIFLSKQQGTVIGADAGVLYGTDTSFDDFNSGTGSYLKVVASTNEEAGVDFDVSSQAYTEIYCGFHMEMVLVSQTETRGFFTLAGATQDLLRFITYDAFERWRVEFYNGSTWDQVGDDFDSTVLHTLNAAKRIDVYFKIADSGGRIVVRINQVTYIDVTQDTLTTADATVDTIKLRNESNIQTTDYRFGPLFVSGTDTQKLIFDEGTTTSIGGFNNVTSGVESDVDEEYGSATLTGKMVAANDGEGATFNMLAADARFDTYNVRSVLALQRTQAKGPSPIVNKGRLRISSVNYDTVVQVPSETEANGSLLVGRWDLDPSTGSAWTNVAAAEAAEVGFICEN